MLVKKSHGETIRQKTQKKMNSTNESYRNKCAIKIKRKIIMSNKHTYSVTYTRRGEPGSLLHTTRMASSAAEARNIVKAEEARRGNIATVVACVKH